jgi:lipopolysaccharide/colanic/teichoic acid biosynthesis glycosyltransferase
LNLDELPQLFNVLKGDMSLVGPRPLPLDDYAHMDRTTYLRRVSVLPGITCTWQISDRSRVTFDEWMRMDLDYIDHWSLKRDLALLVKTVWVVVRGRGDQ